jgi:hypothetical protein
MTGGCLGRLLLIILLLTMRRLRGHGGHSLQSVAVSGRGRWRGRDLQVQGAGGWQTKLSDPWLRCQYLCEDSELAVLCCRMGDGGEVSSWTSSRQRTAMDAPKQQAGCAHDRTGYSEA